jgi:phenylalanine ammonia-lyase
LHFRDSGVPSHFDELWQRVVDSWNSSNALDSEERYDKVSADAVHHVIDEYIVSGATLPPAGALKDWKLAVQCALSETHAVTQHQFMTHQSTPKYLAVATRKLYCWVRQKLQVPLHRGLVDHPGFKSDGCGKKTIGSYITEIYLAIKGLSFTEVLQDITSRLD